MSKAGWTCWLLASVAGVAVLAAPDNDRRLFSISGTHGPSAMDAFGFVLILTAWAVLWAGVWKRRHLLATRSYGAACEMTERDRN
jgi:hypothetical protein